VLVLEGLDHVGTMEHPDLVLPALRDLIDRVERDQS
jgi:hypothetical protein